MRSLLRPIVVNALRAALTIVALGRTMALVAIGLAVALTIQLYPTATGDLGELTPTAKAVVGWGVLAALLVSAALAPSAVRLPRRPADVTWLYTAPLPLWQIALAAGAWHAAVRGGIWLVAGVVVDVASLVRTGVLAGGTGRAVVGVPTIAALSLWSTATATVRGRRIGAVLLVTLGVAGGIAALVAVIAAAARTGSLVFGLERALPVVIADGLGGGLLGAPTATGVLLVSGIIVGSLALLRIAPSPRLRETVVLDATFWATFAPPGAVPTAVPARRRSSWRGGRTLVGPAAFLWFELATYRRAGIPIGSSLALVAGALVVGRWEPGLLHLFTVVIAAGALVGTFASGASLHLQRGDLVLCPGRLATKTAAAELSHLAAAGLPLSAALLAGGLAAGWGGAELVETVGLGVAVVALAFGLRLLATAVAYPPPPGAAAPALVATAIAAGVFAVALLYTIARAALWLGVVLTAWTLVPLVTALAGVAWLGGLVLLQARTASSQG